MNKPPPPYQEIPLFFEVQFILRKTLFPLGFKEQEENVGWIKSVKFSRGKFLFFWDKYLVRLSTHRADGDHYLVAKSMTKSTKEHKDAYDFLVGGDRSKPDEFKANAIMRLNEWLEVKKIT